jgi:acetyl/propionyl-CoA carboxylase alpha subunit
MGVQTNQSYLRSILAHRGFANGNPYTHFLKDHKEDLGSDQTPQRTLIYAIGACLYAYAKRRKEQSFFKSVPAGWRNSFYAPTRQTFLLGGEEISLDYRIQEPTWHFQISGKEEAIGVEPIETGDPTIRFELEGRLYQLQVWEEGGELFVFRPGHGSLALSPQDRLPLPGKKGSEGSYEAPMPGEVIAIAAVPGQRVKKGETLLTLYSMKMEMHINAFRDGTVAQIPVQVGQQVKKGDLLIEMSSDDRT